MSYSLFLKWFAGIVTGANLQVAGPIWNQPALAGFPTWFGAFEATLPPTAEHEFFGSLFDLGRTRQKRF